MHRAHLVLPLALAMLLACQAGDDPSTAPDPAAPATPAPSLGATNLKVLQTFFLIFDDVPERTQTPGVATGLAVTGHGGRAHKAVTTVDRPNSSARKVIATVDDCHSAYSASIAF